MITAHRTKTLTLRDGEREHSLRYEDFAPMKPHDAGGIHPAITDDHQTYLCLPAGVNPSDCPVKTVAIERTDPFGGGTVRAHYAPIVAQLQARYGPDKQVVTAPIDGDAMAQRLHWLKRNKKEQAEMKAVLEWLGAWRLTDDGEIPEGTA